jgi:hypothetical protein
MTSNDESDRRLLRHAVATLAYRGARAARGAPPEFASFHAASSTRTPAEILAHVGDLLDWALSLCRGQEAWKNSPPLPWKDGVARFHEGLARLDSALAAAGPLECPAEKLFQGPIADALTHVGQISMLRRMAGTPVRGENFFRADIAAGRVGPDQAAPKREFD